MSANVSVMMQTPAVRYLGAMAAAAMITFSVFFLMQRLIATGEGVLSEEGDRYVVDFVRVREQDQVKEKEREKPEPPKPVEEPPKPDVPQQSQQQLSNADALSIGGMNLNTDLNIDAGISGGGSSDYLPIVKVAPMYPQNALRRGVEGYVVVEFTVTKAGSVKDPRVVEAQPPGIFDRAAMDAALKFKYRPKMVSGEPMEVAGVRNIIRFELDKGR